MSPARIDFRGQPALRLALAGGDAITVALHGAQVLSWTTADGREHLYLSQTALFDGHSAIRGGVPVCCPQFADRGPLPKHGFMRNLAWTLAEEGEAGLALQLSDDAQTRAIWPHAFCARLEVALAPRRLHIALRLENTGDTPWSFTAALHSYLRVDDVGQVRLEGLQGAPRWDKVRAERSTETAAALAFEGEFDSVFAAAAAPLRLRDGARVLQIAQSASCTETVVWNPGAALCATFADMPDDDYRHMLCVEAARVDAPLELAPGAAWQCWQQLDLG